MPKPQATDVADLLTEATSHLTPVSDRNPWNNGWAYADYRQSDRAALASMNGAVTLDADGLQMYEEAVEELLRRPAVKLRWDREELWELVASLLVVASKNAHPHQVIADKMHQIQSCGPSLTAFVLANTGWQGSPEVIDDVVVGVLGDDFTRTIAAASGMRVNLSTHAGKQWVDSQLERYAATIAADQPLVAFARWSQSQGTRAFNQAQEAFDTLIGLTLLLQPDLEQLELYSLRGNSHRPGKRGTSVDREALETLAPSIDIELTANPIIISGPRVASPHMWHAEDPFPLAALLREPAMMKKLPLGLSSPDIVARRLRVAARWFAESHWSFTKEDGALALGVALDALLGSRSGLPGRVMKERFALLEADPTLREDRSKRFEDLYQVRSAIAHGGSSSRLNADFVRCFAREVSWAANRLIELAERFHPAGEEQLNTIFESLRWGTQTW